ncbi:unnamed protein product [Closterium sp. Naga37s-1]|nr:unnamed protein product [Closterium sp. Naga37s-1]
MADKNHPNIVRLLGFAVGGDVSFGVLMLVVLTGRSSLFEDAGETKHIVVWVSECLSSGGLESLKHPTMDAPGDVVKRLADLAVSCTVERTASRPSMVHIATQLQAVREEVLGKEESGAAIKVDAQVQEMKDAVAGRVAYSGHVVMRLALPFPIPNPPQPFQLHGPATPSPPSLSSWDRNGARDFAWYVSLIDEAAQHIVNTGGSAVTCEASSTLLTSSACIAVVLVPGAGGWRWCWFLVLALMLVPGARGWRLCWVLVLAASAGAGSWCWRLALVLVPGAGAGAGAGSWCWRRALMLVPGAGGWRWCWFLVLAAGAGADS